MALFAAAIGKNTIEITAAPLLANWFDPGAGAHHVASIPLDPRNKSTKDYTNLLIANGWKPIGEWEWVGKVLQIEIEKV